MTSRKLFFVCALLLLMVGIAGAQLPPVKTSLGPKPPEGVGGCAVDKPTCAEVAPAIIKSALGQSPIAENLRHLTDVIGGRVTGSPAAVKSRGMGCGSVPQIGRGRSALREIHGC